MAKEKIIVTRIYGAKAGDKEDMLSLLAQFKPLFIKYAYFLNNDDAFNDLQAFFIEFVKKVDLEKIHNHSDGAMVNYIKTAVYNEYARLVRCKIDEKDNQYIIDTDDNILEKATEYNDDYSRLFFQSLAIHLTEDEYTVIYEMFYNGRKPAEVSEIMGTSVWNVYKLKEKAFKKLSKVLAE